MYRVLFKYYKLRFTQSLRKRKMELLAAAMIIGALMLGKKRKR